MDVTFLAASSFCPNRDSASVACRCVVHAGPELDYAIGFGDITRDAGEPGHSGKATLFKTKGELDMPYYNRSDHERRGGDRRQMYAKYGNYENYAQYSGPERRVGGNRRSGHDRRSE